MAKRVWKVEYRGTSIAWVDAVLGSTAFQFDTREVHKDLKDAIFFYGIKQILADGGALPDGASAAARLAAMKLRAESLKNGTWGTRRVSSGVSDEAALAHLSAKLGMDVAALRKMVGM